MILICQINHLVHFQQNISYKTGKGGEGVPGRQGGLQISKLPWNKRLAVWNWKQTASPASWISLRHYYHSLKVARRRSRQLLASRPRLLSKSGPTSHHFRNAPHFFSQILQGFVTLACVWARFPNISAKRHIHSGPHIAWKLPHIFNSSLSCCHLFSTDHPIILFRRALLAMAIVKWSMLWISLSPNHT